MSRSEGYSIYCCLCKTSFDSAASMLLHLPKHVKKPRQNNYEDKNFGHLDSFGSCHLACNNNCYEHAQHVCFGDQKGENDKRTVISDCRCRNVAISSPCSDSKPTVTDDNKECDINKKIISSNINCDGSEPYKVPDNNESASEHYFDDMDPSEYCITMIEEQEYSDTSMAVHVAKFNNEECPLNGTKGKFKRKYACRLCSKIFGWSTDLKRHILIHTGERPFKCKSCNASFTRNFLLQKHLSKVHPCCISSEKLKCIEEGVELNLKLLKESLNIPNNVHVPTKV